MSDDPLLRECFPLPRAEEGEREGGNARALPPVARDFFDLKGGKRKKNLSLFLLYLATSVPDKSSLGSGSVYPSAFASATTSAKLLPGLRELKM